MSVTVNAFPPLHAFTSARSWFMAIIILLHVGFFWALSSGMKPMLIKMATPPFVVDFFEDVKKPEPPPQLKPVEVVDLLTDPVVVPKPEIPDLVQDTREDVMQAKVVQEPTQTGGSTREPPPAVITHPETDARYGLSEPYYPPPEIRLGHEGTVLLSVQVLPNGRVGEVRLERSSGFARLDDSAMREARKWRFKAGTRDGTPVAMWKQVPITFQLKN